MALAAAARAGRPHGQIRAVRFARPEAVGTQGQASPEGGSSGEPMVLLEPSGGQDSGGSGGSGGTASVGNRVWNDVNGNGAQDEGEPGIDGVTLHLLTATGAWLHSTVTSNGGSYQFTGLASGGYVVKFDRPGNYKFTDQDQGGNDALDSDADPATGSASVTLADNEHNDTIDAGLYPPCSVGDRVWFDTNRDGIQDQEETQGVAGVTVTLFNEYELQVGQATTGADGFYIFSGLAKGTYWIKFQAPEGYLFTVQGAVPDERLDSDADPITGRTDDFMLTPGMVKTTIDAGLYVPGGSSGGTSSIGDRVWNDSNGNGIQNEGEPGINYVTVHLLNGAGTELDSTFTDDGGYYHFDGLTSGGYVVKFDPPGNYKITDQDQGGNDALDSDADPATGRTGLIILGDNDHNNKIDAGLYASCVVGDRVWNDTNSNGIQDPGENQGVAGVTVTLFNEAGVVQGQTTTTADGSYTCTR